MNRIFRPGDLVVYRKSKHSQCPGPRAANIQPAAHGDSYNYTVDKYWIVKEVHEDGTITASTRRGKEHSLNTDDPLLRRANILQRLLHRARFSDVETLADIG